MVLQVLESKVSEIRKSRKRQDPVSPESPAEGRGREGKLASRAVDQRSGQSITCQLKLDHTHPPRITDNSESLSAPSLMTARLTATPINARPPFYVQSSQRPLFVDVFRQPPV